MRDTATFSDAVTAVTSLQMGFGQEQDARFERLSIEDGLSQASVYAILQDRHGFIWLGTQDGLNRYDGYDITVFKHTQFDSSSPLADNNIRAFTEDHVGHSYSAGHFVLSSHSSFFRKRIDKFGLNWHGQEQRLSRTQYYRIRIHQTIFP